MNKIILFCFFEIFLFQYANCQITSNSKHFNLEKGLAVKGYDLVAYFSLKKAIKGELKISTVIDGVTYYFSSLSNKEIFLKEPLKFMPQYGGWCAYAMGTTGEKVDIDPETFKIVNNKLYLFYHTWINNTLTKWNMDENTIRVNADKNWQILIKK